MSNADVINELYRQRAALYNGEVNQEALATIIDFDIIPNNVEPEEKPIVIKIHTMAEDKAEFERSFDNIKPVKLESLSSKFVQPTKISTGEPYMPSTEIKPEKKENPIPFQKTLEQAA